ncbi:hypothetical protein LIH_04695 [Leptospira interrogans serovar Hardjo-prajitno]|uniref:Uncharacterized protein n=2 Tax=Leptospira interrogans TaxID=173 RepID=A0AAQ1NYB2_LEPIR|nr:hypothetical protein BRAT_13890 [Leptospira interrogans serovar Bratislava]AKP25193.1 hypothetical protein LIMLP_03990 [Leptospira interrogans serovar Manilae]ALN99652.1 hypothetical protein LIH_04695 [Leptospira interrogans serovar Hardjo-prajitno]EMM81016.1 hypothetical protein LEP1GSC037_5115 [Leptospira interrogans str. 2006001854]KYZ61187.1 hypothetical protein AWU66_04250 [Leptospira interrogans serovar Pomona]MCR8628692.1 hypothetical protein [Leptospira interrogans serovar Canicola]
MRLLSSTRRTYALIGQFSPTFQEFKTFRATRKEQEKPKDGICETITLQ